MRWEYVELWWSRKWALIVEFGCPRGAGLASIQGGSCNGGATLLGQVEVAIACP